MKLNGNKTTLNNTQKDLIVPFYSSSKFRRLSVMALLALGTTATALMTSDTEVQAATENQNAPVHFTPQFSPGTTQFIPENVGERGDSIDPDRDGHPIQSYRLKANTHVRYKNVGRWEGQTVDMVVTVTNPNAPIKYLWFGTSDISVSIDNDKKVTAGEVKTADINVKFVVSGTSNLINFGASPIGIAYSDLEPAFFYVNGIRYNSLEQSMQSTTPVKYWKNLPGASSKIDRGAVASDRFIMADGVNVPLWALQSPTNQGTQANLRNKYKESGAVGVHYTNQNNLTFKVRGRAGILDLFYLSNAEVKATPPTTQEKPTKTIDYEGKKTTETTLKDAKHPYTYEIKTNLKKDEYVSGVGLQVKDKMPDGFVVTGVDADATAKSYFTMNNASNVNSTRTFTATASENVFDANRTVTFRITGYINKETAFTTEKINNTAEVIPPNGSDGGGSSNTVTTHIPRRDITFNYWDFDHNERKLKDSTVFRNIPVGYGIRENFTPSENITWATNGKNYKHVVGKNDGKYSNPITYNNDNTVGKSNFDLIYRTKWSYYLLHQVKGTTPSYKDTVNKDGDLLAIDKGEMFWKTDDAKGYNNLYIKPRMELKDSKGRFWLPVEGGKVQRKAESDEDILRENYERWKMETDFDWIQLDTTKADTGKTPMEARYHVTNNRPYPLLTTEGLDDTTEEGREAIKNVNNINEAYKNTLLMLTKKVNFDNTTTSSTGVFKEDGKLFTEDTISKKEIPFVLRDKELKDTKLKKNTNNKIEAKVEISNPEAFEGSPNAKAETSIRTASEKTLTNADLKKNKIEYSEEVRTLYEGKLDKINHYKETFNLDFTPTIKIKTGYYNTSDLKVDYKSETDQEKYKFENFSMNTPKKMLDGDRKASQANAIKGYDMVVANKEVKNKDFATPKLPDLKAWKDTTNSTMVDYQQVYSDMKDGTLHTAKELKTTPSTSKNMLDGGKRYYVPVWADVKPFTATYKSQDEKAVKDYLGVNKVQIDLSREFNIVSQMYSDHNSGTKGRDELFMQPVYTDKDYDSLPKNLNAKDKEWLTSINESSVKD